MIWPFKKHFDFKDSENFNVVPNLDQTDQTASNPHQTTQKDIVETTEFFVPLHGLDIDAYLNTEDTQSIHHLARYHWAKQVLQERAPKTILDIACGAGYGSYILSNAMPNTLVTGVDYDERAIEQAQSTYSNDNLTYLKGNLVTWEMSDKSGTQSLGQYDAITSFDTIEHLLHREIALLHLTQNLTDSGVLLFSTPCGHEQSLLNPGWEHHKIEYSHRDLYNLMRRFFHRVLLPENGSLPKLEYWNEVINKDTNRYLNLMNPIVCEKPIKY